MGQAVEWFIAVTTLTVSASHLVRPLDSADIYRSLSRWGRPGAFVNGGLSLAPGAAIVAGHGSWVWPGVMLTTFGWLLVAKGMVCLIASGWGLRSMARGETNPRGFMIAGIAALAVGGWSCFCIWQRG